MKTVKLYRLKTTFYDGFKWDIIIAATGMDWVTMWIDNDNGELISDMSIIEFCNDLDIHVLDGFSMSKGIDETIPEFVKRIVKTKV